MYTRLFPSQIRTSRSSSPTSSQMPPQLLLQQDHRGRLPAPRYPQLIAMEIGRLPHQPFSPFFNDVECCCPIVRGPRHTPVRVVPRFVVVPPPFPLLMDNMNAASPARRLTPAMPEERFRVCYLESEDGKEFSSIHQRRGGKHDDAPSKQKEVVRFCRWLRPTHGWLKLNTDASASPTHTGIAGLLRAPDGRMIFGFSIPVDCMNRRVYQLELLAILRALEIINYSIHSSSKKW